MIGHVNRSRTAFTALSILSMLAVGACSGDDPEPKIADPSPTSSLPTSPSTTAASSPVEPTMPPGAQGTDAAAAEAFVKFYWEMVNYAQATGDLSGLKSLASEACAACRAGTDYLDRVFGSDGIIEGGVASVRVTSSGFIRDGADSDAVVVFDVRTTRQTVDYPGTRDDEVFPGGKTRLTAILDPEPGGWLMQSWDEE